jgi:hypothetical protein
VTGPIHIEGATFNDASAAPARKPTCSRSSARTTASPSKQPNKDYWTVHLDEFFDRFLLGAPTPECMTHNGSYEHRGEREVDALFTPATF